MKAKYPIFMKTALPLITAEKIKKVVEKQNSSISEVVRRIIEKYFELNQEKIKMTNKVVTITVDDRGGTDEVICRWYKCPKCGNKIRMCFKFCTNCGIRLKWNLTKNPSK